MGAKVKVQGKFVKVRGQGAIQEKVGGGGVVTCKDGRPNTTL